MGDVMKIKNKLHKTTQSICYSKENSKLKLFVLISIQLKMLFESINSTISLVKNGEVNTMINPIHEFLTKLIFKIFTNTALYYAGVFMPLGLVCNALILIVLFTPRNASCIHKHPAAAAAPVPTSIRRVSSSVQLSELDTRLETS